MGNSMMKVNEKNMKIPSSPKPDASASVKPPEKQHEPGEGIRSLKTSNIFRTLNFELYARPNKTVMVIGVVGFTVCVGYLTYLNYYHYDHNEYYEAFAEDGTKILRPKKSRWDS
ncbi:unnamed protein product [Orchesella dallaii]|uniref:Small integral membrane protein 8 n=1 Tax=Orchesella dallaii TaxID=48710 RepID=A0ABP1QIL5_9HEXA